MKTCLNCGTPFENASIHQPDQKYCCGSCANTYLSRKYREQRRDHYNDRTNRRPHHKFYIYVRQPGMAEWDGWHKLEYDKYKHDLPKGTELMRP